VFLPTNICCRNFLETLLWNEAQFCLCRNKKTLYYGLPWKFSEDGRDDEMSEPEETTAATDFLYKSTYLNVLGWTCFSCG